MGDLHNGGITPARLFSLTGVDYSGLFLLKDRKHRNFKLTKPYICIFICFATRAMHSEVVSDLTTEYFISASRRFVSRRRLCKNIMSDNSSNFVGAKAQLKKMPLESDETIETNLSSPSNRLSGFQHIQEMMQHFWSKWAKEYVSNLQVRTKWKENHIQLLKLGTLVHHHHQNGSWVESSPAIPRCAQSDTNSDHEDGY
ncbi:hypothetical protein JTB14_036306 [Gonioctena quinquepunctata]|nr:hypothetical protein JTB14_036306 [Gonioctena quinquepunctata]